MPSEGILGRLLQTARFFCKMEGLLRNEAGQQQGPPRWAPSRKREPGFVGRGWGAAGGTLVALGFAHGCGDIGQIHLHSGLLRRRIG